jgi:glyoxylase-like metal-dependent hydrolase (beta-lactamase superfamily II)
MNDTNIWFRIGNAHIARVKETEFNLPSKVLYPNSADALSVSPDTEFTLSVHSWLVQMNGLNILIDTGIGNFKERPFSTLFHQLNTPFLDRLNQTGISPEQINYVLLTHLHTDHVGWNTYLKNGKWVPTFPNAKYLAPQKDLEFLFTDQGSNRRILFDDSILPLIIRNQLTVIPQKGGEVLQGIEFIPSPGHCVGHMSIKLRSDKQIAYFSGDIMHNAVQVAAPNVNSIFCFDIAQANETRRTFLSQVLLEKATVFTAHFGQTSAGRIQQNINEKKWQYLEPIKK